ncbi:heat-inducible transcriptional repressor HrcA [Citromicrobium bathyomarinum]|jgi:heat-inducible transcriptional repressor|uniref:heat-inducible transcriptional repressor HrcA n=1 Tax=Sphingomonadales TaxID=204457 RepID=UPI000C580F20|nr:heat-inducible transcriptional repressor HrcA [Citromicrobium sp.]MBO82462.1 heat-inducible transcriptional repressor HrcA [Citromicrobium sp.]|tara:strand:+ start:8632 stop:9672 length:1041 start_codon:yes stop_codon:yes gene_type:complete
MSTPPLTELTARTRDIFRVVVEQYLATGQPVGSKTLAEGGAVDLSPASIRSVLADLEKLGLLAAPHVSAGRKPTESGLRLFVDGMMQITQPSEQERHAIEAKLGDPGPLEARLEAASAMLSDLSGAAGMVFVPTSERRLAQMNFLPLDANRALAVLVDQNGQIENRLIEMEGMDASALSQASNYLSARMANRSLGEALKDIEAEIAGGRSALDEASKDLVRRGIAMWSETPDRSSVLIVRGQAKLLDDEAVGDVERVRQLLDELENKRAVADVLERARKARATRIYIGSENRLFALSGSSVIASPFHDRDGNIVGVLGVIGPTRLNYARIVPMVDFTAQSLGRLTG